jgi:single-strand DNA-binding protein
MYRPTQLLTARRGRTSLDLTQVGLEDVGPSLRNASAKVNRVAGAGDGGYGGQRSSGGQGGYGGGEPDPWASDSPGGYSDEPPF